MFTHRSFLIIGDSEGDILSLIKNGIEISNCNFSFLQDIDQKGKATTKVYAGAIEVTAPQLPPKHLIEWGLNSKKYLDGMIVSVDNENLPLEKILFKNAACVDFEIEYNRIGESYSSTKFIIQAEKMIVGNGVDFTNEWIY